jgi:hypothetical protein
MAVQRWLFVVTRYLTYTFGPISIRFIQPFLDDTSRTLRAVLRPKNELVRGCPTFPEGPPECWNCATCSEIEVEKGLKSILNPSLLQK